MVIMLLTLEAVLCVCAVCVQVWDVSTGAVVFEVGAKSVHKEAWPLLHWGTDDKSLYHGVTNTVHQYSRADGFKGESPWD